MGGLSHLQLCIVLSVKCVGIDSEVRSQTMPPIGVGGNAKTRVIATLSPSSDCVEESVSTLKFADRAKQVMVFLRRNGACEV